MGRFARSTICDAELPAHQNSSSRHCPFSLSQVLGIRSSDVLPELRCMVVLKKVRELVNDDVMLASRHCVLQLSP